MENALLKIALGTKDATIFEQRQRIVELQADLSGMASKIRALEGQLFGLQRNFSYQVEEHGRVVEKINIERDSILAQLTALKCSTEGTKSTRIIAVQELLDRNDSLTAANTAMKHQVSLLRGHLEEWRIAFAELDIYSHGLESLLHIQGYYRVNMPNKPQLVFDAAVKRELEE